MIEFTPEQRAVLSASLAYRTVRVRLLDAMGFLDAAERDMQRFAGQKPAGWRRRIKAERAKIEAIMDEMEEHARD